MGAGLPSPLVKLKKTGYEPRPLNSSPLSTRASFTVWYPLRTTTRLGPRYTVYTDPYFLLSWRWKREFTGGLGVVGPLSLPIALHQRQIPCTLVSEVSKSWERSCSRFPRMGRGLGPGGSWPLPHEVKVRDREMTARRRSKMAVLTPSIVKAAAVPVGKGRWRAWNPSIQNLLECSSSGSRQ